MNTSTEPSSNSTKSIHNPEHDSRQDLNEKPLHHSYEQRQDPQQHCLSSSTIQYDDDNFIDEIQSALIANRDFRRDCRAADRGRKCKSRIFDLLKAPEFKKRFETPPAYKKRDRDQRPPKSISKTSKKQAKKAEKKLVKEMKKLSTK